MFTDSRHHRRSEAPKPVGVLARVAERMQRFVCGLHGHDALLHFERGHMSLLCTSCGYESPGWDIKDASGAVRERVDAGGMRTLPLVRERRVA